MAELFVHCGLHKTGTTSIQKSLSSHRERLAGDGLLYPSSGCVSGTGGHHNIAWELIGDRRRRVEPGGTSELLAEISNFSGNVIVSTEDFETILGRVDLLAAISRLAHQAQRTLNLIVYLRDQLSYIASLYQTLLNHGLTDEFAAVAHLVLTQGGLSYREWMFQFDYGHIARCLTSMADLQIILRNYNNLAPRRSVIADLSEIIGIRSPLIDALEPETRWAQREAIGVSLAKFYQSRAIEDFLTPPETATLADVIARMRGRAGAPGPDLAGAFVDAFVPGNLQLCAQFTLPADGLNFHALAGDRNTLHMERVFSNTAVSRIREIATLGNRGGAIEDLIGWFAGT
jgi:hypothetical protein